MSCCEHKLDPLPRTPSAVVNLQHLKECCNHADEIDTSGIQHPYAPFMERAIYLSRVAGLEKRTGNLIGLYSSKLPNIQQRPFTRQQSKVPEDAIWHRLRWSAVASCRRMLRSCCS
jgi:hypothetical protein